MRKVMSLLLACVLVVTLSACQQRRVPVNKVKPLHLPNVQSTIEAAKAERSVKLLRKSVIGALAGAQQATKYSAGSAVATVGAIKGAALLQLHLNSGRTVYANRDPSNPFWDNWECGKHYSIIYNDTEHRAGYIMPVGVDEFKLVAAKYLGEDYGSTFTYEELVAKLSEDNIRLVKD